MFRQECEQFDKMGIHEKFIYILTYEGPLLSHVAKFVHEIISVKRDVSVWHMYSKMWYSDVWKSPRGVYHNAYINQGPTLLILGAFGWELLAGAWLWLGDALASANHSRAFCWGLLVRGLLALVTWAPGSCVAGVFAARRGGFGHWHRSFQRKLRSRWLKFLRRVAMTLVMRGPVLYVSIVLLCTVVCSDFIAL